MDYSICLNVQCETLTTTSHFLHGSKGIYDDSKYIHILIHLCFFTEARNYLDRESSEDKSKGSDFSLQIRITLKSNGKFKKRRE